MMLAIVAGGSGLSRLKGPPGASRIRKNDRVTTMKTVGTALISRWETNRNMDFGRVAGLPLDRQIFGQVHVDRVVLPAGNLVGHEP